jgi:predicted nucleic acid binding AN1-type Zn finger protein
MPKYGPTADYGDCECGDCESDARTTCPDCGGHFCLGHVARNTHAPL